MSQITIEQHFVPQIHLKKFVDHHDKKIFVYDKHFRKIYKKYYPVQICKKNYLYEFNLEHPNNGIEGAFSYIETKFAELYENRLKFISNQDKKISLSDDDRLVIIYYILRMDYGNIIDKYTGDEQFWEMWERSIIENCKTKEDLEIAYKKMHLEKKNSEQRRVPLQIKTIFDNFIPCLFKERNIIFIFNNHKNYITSDNPVDNYFSKKFQSQGFYGPSVFDINYQIAVSQNLIIALDDNKEDKEDGDIIVDNHGVSPLQLNSSYFITANQYIYSPRVLTEEEILVYKQKSHSVQN